MTAALADYVQSAAEARELRAAATAAAAAAFAGVPLEGVGNAPLGARSGMQHRSSCVGAALPAGALSRPNQARHAFSVSKISVQAAARVASFVRRSSPTISRRRR